MKHLKSITIISLLTLLTLSFVGCASSYPKPDESVKSFFTAMQKKDIKAADKYTKNGKFIEDICKNDASTRFIVNFFSKAKCEILSSEVHGSKATVKVKVTSVDASTVLNSALNYAKQAVSSGSTNNQSADAIYQNALNKYLANPKTKKHSQEVEIKAFKNKKDNNWLVLVDDNLQNAMTGNMKQAYNKINKIKE